MNLRARLGLDPQSFAALARDVSLARKAGEEDPIVKLGRQGQRMMEARNRIRAEAQARGEDPHSAWLAWLARNPGYADRDQDGAWRPPATPRRLRRAPQPTGRRS